MRFLPLATLLILLLWIFAADAGQTQSSAEALFSSTSLGSNGKSCATCHPQGKGLKNIGDYDDEILQEMVNFCIRDALKGEMLAEKSEELRRLASYLRQFQKK